MAAGVGFCACARTARVTETSARALCVSSISLRRSNASASTPPPRANRTMGATRNRPSMPRASGEPVSRYSCHTTATCCIWVPVSETSWPASSRRKSRDRSATSLPVGAGRTAPFTSRLVAADRAALRFQTAGGVTCTSDPRAGALHRSALDAAFVRGQLRLHPFRPTDVQLLAEEPELCQLQSGLGPDVSVLVPAVHDERLVARELARQLLQLVERDADRALDVGLGERVAGARIEQHDLVRSRLLLHPVDHALLLGLGAQLGREELPVGTNVVR